MWIIVLLWLILIVYKCEYSSKEHYLPFSKDNALALKGICAIEIMLGHLGLATGAVALFANRKAGILFVGVFLALSGYGLMYSATNKENYMGSFLKRRIPKVIVPAVMSYVILTILGAYGEFSIWNLLSIENIFHNINWYVWELILLYVVFYIFSRINDIKQMHWYILIVSIIFILLAFYFKIDNPWYGSTLCFWLGIIYYLKQEKVSTLLSQHKKFLIIALCGIVVCVSILAFFALGEESFVGNVLGRNFASAFFVIMVIVLLHNFKIGNIISNFLGKYSYEIFLFHQGIINLLRPHIKNNLVFSICVIVITILVSWLYRNIANYCKKIMKEN